MLKAASLFTDGAVLCRRKEIRVFGEADSGAAVTVTLRDCCGNLLARNVCTAGNGRFTALLRPQEAMTGCTLSISAGDECFTASDIAVGDVYLAGGQSNMELELQNALGGRVAIREHDDPMLRYYYVNKYALVSDEQRAAADHARWTAIVPGAGGNLSAVAYFFAAKLRRLHPDVPVGIINCNWGGTSVTCWMPEKTLRQTAEGARYLDEYARNGGNKTMAQFLAEEKAWQDEIAAWTERTEAYRAAHPDAETEEVDEACGLYPWHPPVGPGSPFRPGGLHDTMTATVIPAALTGLLFYQGEQDAGYTGHYDLLLAQLVAFWRGQFMDDRLPFLNVQLPMWTEFKPLGPTHWQEIRMAQAKARDFIRDSGMICMLDCGERGNIHPVDKKTPGERLAELALDVVYGEKAELCPRAAGKYADDDRLTVLLTAPVRAEAEDLLLEIAGEDGRFVKAEAEIREDRLILHAGSIARPVHARYAWVEYAEAPLFGLNGQPLEPFLL